MQKLILILMLLAGFANAEDHVFGKSRLPYGYRQEARVKETIPSSLYPPALWYGMNYNDSTVVYDLSGKNNTGTVSGATWVQEGQGGYYSFDGNDSISCTTNQSLNITSTNMFSISAWVNADTNCASGARIICERRVLGGGYFSYGIMGITNSWRVYSIGATRTIGAYSPITVGSWVHLVGTMDFSSGECKLYVNGTLVKTQTAGAVGANGSPTGLTMLGKRDDNTRYWLGDIDRILIWPNTMLTSNQVYNLYLQGRQ